MSPKEHLFRFDEIRGFIERYWQRKKKELLILTRIVNEENPTLAESVNLEEACQVLTGNGSQNGNRVTDPIRTPYFTNWLGTSEKIVLEGYHRTAKANQAVRSHLADINLFALSYGISNRTAFQCEIQNPPERVNIYGLPLFLELGVGPSRDGVRLSTTDGSLMAEVGGRRFSWNLIGLSDSSELLRPPLRRIPCVSGIIFDAYFLKARVPKKLEAFVPPKAQLRVWMRWLEAACKIIDKVEDSLLFPTRELTRVIVPVKGGSRRYVGGSVSQLPAAVFSSLPGDVFSVAEMLIHEPAHSLLNIVTDEIPLWITKRKAPLYVSPWRSDLRPVWGMFHAIWSFSAVGHFWGELVQVSERKTSKVARKRLFDTALKLQLAVGELDRSEELTSRGDRYFELLKEEAERLLQVSASYPPTQEEMRKIQSEIKADFQAKKAMLQKVEKVGPKRHS
jgi:HEXXH motif-containing protein